MPRYQAFLEYGLQLNNATSSVRVRDRVVGEKAGQEYNLTVPLQGNWGTASIDGRNVNKCVSAPCSHPVQLHHLHEHGCGFHALSSLLHGCMPTFFFNHAAILVQLLCHPRGDRSPCKRLLPAGLSSSTHAQALDQQLVKDDLPELWLRRKIIKVYRYCSVTEAQPWKVQQLRNNASSSTAAWLQGTGRSS